MLWENPWQTHLNFETPVLAARNADGFNAVVDGNYGRCIIFDKNGEYRACINSSVSLSAKTVSIFTDIAMTDECLYVLDNRSSDGAKGYNGVRIMRFDFDGKYLNTVYQQQYDSDEKQTALSNIFCYDNSIFCTKTEGNHFKRYILENEVLKLLESRKLPDTELWAGRFSRNGDISVCAINGKFYITRKDDKTVESLDLFGPTQHITSVAFNNRNDLFVIDGNRHAIFQVSQDTIPVEIIKTNSVWLSTSGEELVFCDPTTQNYTVYNPYAEQKNIYQNVAYSSSMVIKRWLVLADAVVLLAFLLFCLAKYVLTCLKNLRQKDEIIRNTKTDGDEEIFTISSLYGHRAMLFLLAFVITICLFMPHSYRSDIQRNLDGVRKLATYVSQTSPHYLGRYLSTLTVPVDFRNPDLKKARQCCERLGAHQEDSSSFLLDYMLFKYLDDKRMLLIDSSSDDDYCGAILTHENQKHLIPEQAFDAIGKGEIFVDGTFSNTMQSNYCCVYVPLFDSNQNVVGMMSLFYNRKWIEDASFHRLFLQAVDLMLLFIAAVYIIGESSLARQFFKKRKKDGQQGIGNRTVIEAHRALNFLLALAGNLFNVFLPIVAINLARANGFKENLNFWAALPFTVLAVTIAIGMPIAGIFVKRNPRWFFLIGAFLEAVVSPAIWILCIIHEWYWTMIAICVIHCIGHSMSLAASNAIAGCGLPVEKRFRHLVFTFVEYTIGVSLACALGSSLYEKFGSIVSFMIHIVTGLLLMVMILLMVQSDINVSNHPEKKQNAAKDKVRCFTYIRAFMTPKVIAFSLFVIFGFGIFGCFQDFLFPLFLHSTGDSLQLVGLANAICTIVSTILISYYLTQKPDFGKNSMLCNIQFCLGICTLIFAFKSNILSFCAIILAYQMLTSVVRSNTLQTFAPFAEKQNIPYSVITGCFALLEFIGGTLGPILTGWLLAKGTALLGIVCGGGILIAGVLYMFFIRIFDNFRLPDLVCSNVKTRGKCLCDIHSFRWRMEPSLTDSHRNK